jgi:hypothetical protein
VNFTHSLKFALLNPVDEMPKAGEDAIVLGKMTNILRAFKTVMACL